MTTTFGVVRFPGSNCDDDAMDAVDRVLSSKGSKGRILWHKDSTCGNVDALIIPGGFSYGDYLRAGAMAAHSPIMDSIKDFAAKGGPVLGICNGFQILCESGLLEGSLSQNESLKFICKDVYCMVEGRPTPFTCEIPAGQTIKMSVAHAEGRYLHPQVQKLEDEGQILFRYCNEDGLVDNDFNPNGSENNIAGVCNSLGNVVGLMPHPERAVESFVGNGGDDGRSIFESAIAFLERNATRA